MPGGRPEVCAVLLHGRGRRRLRPALRWRADAREAADDDDGGVFHVFHDLAPGEDGLNEDVNQAARTSGRAG
jgi:hypothetical protein